MRKTLATHCCEGVYTGSKRLVKETDIMKETGRATVYVYLC